MTSKKEDLLTILVMFLIGLVAIFGGAIYMNHRKEQNLYKHGFRLLEEQIAVYIKEHYSGVSKVEFTDIYIMAILDFMFIPLLRIIMEIGLC